MKILTSFIILLALVTGATIWIVLQSKKEKEAVPLVKEVAKPPIATVVPHHDLATKLIDEILRETASRNKSIDNIILIGPDHKSTTEQQILTSNVLFDTKGQIIQVNEDNIEYIIKSNYVKLSNEKIASEHSIGVVAPLVVKNFPNAKITPIIISASTSQEMLSDFLNMLTNMHSENTLYVASVDFSHYLDKESAEHKDAETYEIISSKNYDRLIQLKQEHIDSPESLWGIMKIAEIYNRDNLEILSHSNSTEFGATSTNVTTYFGLIFW